MRQDGAEAGMAADGDAKGSEPATIAPMFTDAQMVWLRRAVVIMGVLLLLGFAVVIGRVVYLLNKPAAAVSTQAAMPRSGAPAPESKARLVLPAGAQVKHMALGEARLAVHYEAPGGAGILVLDVVTGAVVQRIELAPEAPR
jgi:hypothetical protein